MADLDGTTTLTAATTSYQDNACYEEDADAAKAAKFVTACVHLIRLLPSHAGLEGAASEFSIPALQAELAHARRFVAHKTATTDGGAGVRFADFRDFRT